MVCVGVGSTLSAAVPLAAAAAALFVQAADQAAEAAVGQVAAWGEELARRADDQASAELTNRRWHMVAAEAVGVNAAIRMIDVRAGRLGVAIELPAPVDLNGRSLDDVSAWLNRVEPAVRAARSDLDRAAAEAEWRRLPAELAPAAAGMPSVADELHRYQEALAGRHAVAPAAADVAPADLSPIEAEVHAVLARLDPDADAADREAALRAAALVARQTDASDADAYLFALSRVVDKDVRVSVAGRRLAACWLEAVEQPMVERALTADLRLPWTGVARALRDVVAGSAPMTPELHRQGKAMVAWAGDVARVAYRLGLLTDLLQARGYMITAQSDAEVRLTRPGWGDHGASVRMAPDGGVRNGLMAPPAAGGDDTALREADAEAELHRHVAEAVHEMSHDGVHGLVARPHEIQRHHDACAAGTPTEARVAAPKERTRGR